MVQNQAGIDTIHDIHSPYNGILKGYKIGPGDPVDSE